MGGGHRGDSRDGPPRHRPAQRALTLAGRMPYETLNQRP